MGSGGCGVAQYFHGLGNSRSNKTCQGACTLGNPIEQPCTQFAFKSGKTECKTCTLSELTQRIQKLSGRYRADTEKKILGARPWLEIGDTSFQDAWLSGFNSMPCCKDDTSLQSLWLEALITHSFLQTPGFRSGPCCLQLTHPPTVFPEITRLFDSPPKALNMKLTKGMQR